nr:glycosyltransferase [uncultured Campylobacter sp.]
MKILFIISNLANGGAERVLSTLCDEFSKMGDTCEILYFEQNSGYYEYKATLTHLPLYEKRGILAKFSKFWRINKAIKKSNSNAVISMLDQTNINVLISTFFAPKSVIISEHTDARALKSRFWRAMRRLLYPRAKALVVLNESEKNYYNFSKNAKVIYNPLNADFLSHRIPVNKENIVLCVGRLESVKNYEFYLKSLALISPDLRKNWRFIIAGDGSQKERLLALNDELKIGAEFIGHTKNTKELYAKASILALPSKSESFGNVLAECISFYCARISTPTAGAGELITHAKDGIIASELEFAKALEELMRDESLRSSLAKNALKRLADFEPAKIALKYKELILS